MRILLAVLAAVLVCAGPARAGTLQPVQLPRDHGAHPGFGVEWWYTTGHAGRYFWFATIWAAPQGAVGRVNVVDLKRDKVVLAKQWTRTGPFAAGATKLSAGGLRLQWLPSGKLGRVTVDARVDKQNTLRLRLTPRRPYALHGNQGIVPQGPSGTSAYYSGTRLSTRGTLRRNGTATRFTGLAWFDHQWGDFGSAPGALRWDWFACQLDDGRDLMVAQALDAAYQPVPGIRQGTLVAPDGRTTHISDFTATPFGPTLEPAGATTTYPLDWHLVVPQAGLDLKLRAAARHQFVPMQILPSFWEGQANVKGGVCTVENSREAPA